jgi:hypothetical protein
VCWPPTCSFPVLIPAGRPLAPAGGQGVRATIWTPAGLAVLALLLLVLLAREFIRVSGRAAVRFIRLLTLASLPLLVLLLVVVAERFVVLS